MQALSGSSPQQEGENSLFSIVVTAYNNGSSISECVESLRAQTYRPKEIVIVLDDASTDDTSRAVRGMEGSSLVTVVPCSKVGRSEARNMGWKRANGEMVMFADGDDVYGPEYLSKAATCLQGDPSIGGVCLGGAPLRVNNSIIARYEASYGPTDSRIRPQVSGPDWAFVYRKECLSIVGGYRPNLSQAEDRDLCTRVKNRGYKIGYVPGVNWYHRKPSTFGELIAKEFRAGERRVAYEAETGHYKSFVTSMSPLLFLILCGVFAIFSLPGSLILLILGLASYVGLSWRVRGRNAVGLSEKIAFPLVSLSGRLAGSLGTFVGSIGTVFGSRPRTDG